MAKAKPPSKALVNKALRGQLTRANTKPGTAARRAVYRSEYVKREAREQRFGVSYPQARRLREALRGQLTRANTKPGTAARRAVYRSEYVKREAREQRFDVSYPQARRLRESFPLSSATRAELKRNHKNITAEHTRYAIIRAQVVRAQLEHGKHPGKKKARGARAAGHLPRMEYPTAALAAWYRNAWGSDYDPRAFANVAGGGEGLPPEPERIAQPQETEEEYGRELIDYAEGEGEDLEQEFTGQAEEPSFEDYYGDFDTDEWDVWEFGEY